MKQNSKTIFAGLTALSLLGSLLTPLAANAQRDHDDSRYQQSNQDRRDRRDDNNNRDRRDDNYNRDHRDNTYNRDRRDDTYNRDHRDDSYNRDNQARYHRNRDSYSGYTADRREQTKNEWRNIAIGSGALGVVGLLSHDNFLTFAGGAGALYSLSRYQNDQRSQDRASRLRAEYFSRPYFYRDGARYDRRIVERNGHQYYQFYRH